LHCGLPAIGKNSGCYPELLSNKGKIFNTPEDIPKLLKEVVTNYKLLQDNINTIPSIAKVADQYLAFCKNVYTKTTRPKQIPFLEKMIILFFANGHHLYDRICNIFRALKQS
jgi:hypothetical protein